MTHQQKQCGTANTRNSHELISRRFYLSFILQQCWYNIKYRTKLFRWSSGIGIGPGLPCQTNDVSVSIGISIVLYRGNAEGCGFHSNTGGGGTEICLELFVVHKNEIDRWNTAGLHNSIKPLVFILTKSRENLLKTSNFSGMCERFSIGIIARRDWMSFGNFKLVLTTHSTCWEHHLNFCPKVLLE